MSLFHIKSFNRDLIITAFSTSKKPGKDDFGKVLVRESLVQIHLVGNDPKTWFGPSRCRPLPGIPSPERRSPKRPGKKSPGRPCLCRPGVQNTNLMTGLKVFIEYPGVKIDMFFTNSN